MNHLFRSEEFITGYEGGDDLGPLPCIVCYKNTYNEDQVCTGCAEDLKQLEIDFSDDEEDN